MMTKPNSAYAAAISCANCGLSVSRASSVGMEVVIAGYCAYRFPDVEVGNAGWERRGPIGPIAVCKRRFDGSPEALRIQRANGWYQSLSTAGSRWPERGRGRGPASPAGIRRLRRGAGCRGRQGVRGAGFGYAAQSRRRVSEQLGELSRGRHRRPVPHARRESPHGTAARGHRDGGARNRLPGAPGSRPDAT